MIRSFVRAALIGAAALGAIGVSQAASATTFMLFNGNASATAGNALSLSSNDGSGLSLSLYGGHLDNTSGGLALSSGATVATYDNYGTGVLFGSDNTNNGTHQIDNAGGGADYVALVFNQAVTLSQFALKAYGGAGVGTGTDAQFRTYSGTVGDLTSGTKNLWEGYFKNASSSTVVYPNTASAYTLDTTGSSDTSKIWLVSANTTQTTDAFKLLAITANGTAPGAVPEPASWALMIVGFGMVGSAIRRTKQAPLVNA